MGEVELAALPPAVGNTDSRRCIEAEQNLLETPKTGDGQFFLQVV